MHVHDFFFFLYFVTFRELLIRLRTTDGKAAFIHLMSEPLLASYEEIIVLSCCSVSGKQIGLIL